MTERRAAMGDGAKEREAGFKEEVDSPRGFEKRIESGWVLGRRVSASRK